MLTIPGLAAILMLAFRAAAQDYGQSPDFRAASYQILDAGLFGSLQKKADDASIGGYHVAAGFERVVVMRRALAGERSVTTTASPRTQSGGDRRVRAADRRKEPG